MCCLRVFLVVPSWLSKLSSISNGHIFGDRGYSQVFSYNAIVKLQIL
jgi:hypothetical protein